jgi:hypothetical protein
MAGISSQNWHGNPDDLPHLFVKTSQQQFLCASTYAKQMHTDAAKHWP